MFTGNIKPGEANLWPMKDRNAHGKTVWRQVFKNARVYWEYFLKIICTIRKLLKESQVSVILVKSIPL